MKNLKAKVEELERFIKGEIASFRKKFYALEEELDKRNELEKKKIGDLKKNLNEMQIRLHVVEKELEKDFEIL